MNQEVNDKYLKGARRHGTFRPFTSDSSPINAFANLLTRARSKPRSDATLNGPAFLQASQLTFSFNGTPILDRVDLSLEPGKLVGVLGPNGAGKSTLVRLLSRLLSPRSGSISLNGLELSQWNHGDIARVLAVVPQDPELPPSFTAWEMVLLGRTPYLGWMGRDSETDRAIAKQAMEDTQTWHLAQRFITQLSGGEQQRVVIARALAQQPHVLLLDEPTSHLDINHQIETLKLVTAMVKKRQLSAMAIFHDLNLAAQYCDEIILLRNGKILAKGAVDQVLTPALIQQAFGAPVGILAHPTNGLPVIVPV